MLAEGENNQKGGSTEQGEQLAAPRDGRALSERARYLKVRSNLRLGRPVRLWLAFHNRLPFLLPVKISPSAWCLHAWSATWDGSILFAPTVIAAVSSTHGLRSTQGLSRAVPVRVTMRPQDHDDSTLSVPTCEEHEHMFTMVVAQQTLY